MANRIVGNAISCAALECTLTGPTLQFCCETIIAITGGVAQARIDGEGVALNQALRIYPGQVLNIGTLESGYRVYVAIANGIDIPETMGSCSTFEMASIGGYKGQKLRKGDVIPIFSWSTPMSNAGASQIAPLVPISPGPNRSWRIGVIPGPHGAPDMFNSNGLRLLFKSNWKVHFNSNRLGIRLTGPRPEWARNSGGMAGIHPSNIHDAPYSIGSVSFTGDEAIVLTCDGPSLGGFAVFCVVASAELWKLGQVRPGDEIHLMPISLEHAYQLEKRVSEAIDNFSLPSICLFIEEDSFLSEVVVGQLTHGNRKILARQAGDCALLFDFGHSDGFDMC